MPSVKENFAEFIKGTIFRKNIINKKMRKDIQNAKILIVTGNLEYSAKQEDTYQAE